MMDELKNLAVGCLLLGLLALLGWAVSALIGGAVIAVAGLAIAALVLAWLLGWTIRSL